MSASKTYTLRRWVVWTFVLFALVPSVLRLPWTIDYIGDWVRTWP